MRGLAVAILALPLALPAFAGERKSVDDAGDLRRGETIVVGRVELVPPLHENEQRLRGPGSRRMRDKMYVLVAPELREVSGEPSRSELKERIDATLGSDFFVRSDAERTFVNAGVVILESGDGYPDLALFPGGLVSDIHPDDRAVYVGTLRYHRNEFFEITGVEVVDEFERVAEEFASRFGRDQTLRKAILRPVDPPD